MVDSGAAARGGAGRRDRLERRQAAPPMPTARCWRRMATLLDVRRHERRRRRPTGCRQLAAAPHWLLVTARRRSAAAPAAAAVLDRRPRWRACTARSPVPSSARSATIRSACSPAGCRNAPAKRRCVRATDACSWPTPGARVCAADLHAEGSGVFARRAGSGRAAADPGRRRRRAAWCRDADVDHRRRTAARRAPPAARPAAKSTPSALGSLVGIILLTWLTFRSVRADRPDPAVDRHRLSGRAVGVLAAVRADPLAHAGVRRQPDRRGAGLRHLLPVQPPARQIRRSIRPRCCGACCRASA